MSATNPLIATITSPEPAVRDRALSELIAGLSTAQVLQACDELESFRRSSDNLYERVRASIYLHWLYRYRIQEAPEIPEAGFIPFAGFEDLLGRRFEQAIAAFLAAAGREGLNSALASALAQAYEHVTYQTLADQVRRSVRGCAGNRWMFRVGHPDEHPVRLDRRLLERDPATGQFPILVERTPVRLDLSHSGWSDIFFLGMDYPEGARVLNISVDLGVHGRDAAPLPPIETYVRVIAEPLLRLTSIDLEACKDIKSLDELFNFGNDYLGLVKAGVIASGLIPPSLEGTGIPLPRVLDRIVRPGYGLEVVSKVNDIPKGSRLAVSTNLLASLISLLMRATGQSQRFLGPQGLDESRVVVSRAILGEWLGGSGGGWQDSGGVFPGVKLIQGVPAAEGDPEWTISRGRLLPLHSVLTAASPDYKNETAAATSRTGRATERIRERLGHRGKRLTREYELIVEEVVSSSDPFDVDQLVARLSSRTEGRRVSRATVYRMIQKLVDEGLLRQVPRVEDRQLFEYDSSGVLLEQMDLESNDEFAAALAGSLVLVHGGMAQNVGPILNMVTEKYLLRGADEWRLRQEALQIFEELLQAVDASAVRDIGRLTTANWQGPLKGIIPWVSNCFTEAIIRESRARLGEDFWGFLMLGGMSGGGMGFFVAPHRHAAFRDEIREIMRRAKDELGDALPFAMEPVVYDFRINPHGTHSELRSGREALMPSRYYPLQVARMIAEGATAVDPQRKLDLDLFAGRDDQPEELIRVFRTMVNTLFPATRNAGGGARVEWDQASEEIRRENGFDPVQHAQLRDDLHRGRIGLARNRLPVDTDIRDVNDTDVIPLPRASESARRLGAEAIRRGEAAVVSLAAGVGSRWTTGAGVVKAINPFVELEGRHRSFLEIHLAKTRKTSREFGCEVPHVVTTSFLTHSAIARHLERTGNYGHTGPVLLSRGQSIGQRLVPMARDLTFLWEESVHETLDENKQKVREAGRRAILDWARGAGEATDYTDNVPIQRFNPPGHFYEVPNLLRNGVLLQLFQDYPRLRWLMVHNIDTLGANLDPAALGLAIQSGATLTFEAVPRRVDDRGGGLARVNGRVRILEGLATPREEAEFSLRYYNTLTTWVDVEGLLNVLRLTRDDLRDDQPKVTAAIRTLAARVPTYVTIKDVKRRWGHGQEDVFPVAQFEKLWGDLTSLTDLPCAFLAVDRRRGQQLKDPAQLDGWSNDGNRRNVLGLCEFA